MLFEVVLDEVPFEEVLDGVLLEETLDEELLDEVVADEVVCEDVVELDESSLLPQPTNSAAHKIPAQNKPIIFFHFHSSK